MKCDVRATLVNVKTHVYACSARMLRSKPLPAAVLQQLSATREATRTLHNFESAGDLEDEVQAIHASTVDDCIVSPVKAIRALSEHSLSDLQTLVGPILIIIEEAREQQVPPYTCKRRRTRSSEESGEDRSHSDKA